MTEEKHQDGTKVLMMVLSFLMIVAIVLAVIIIVLQAINRNVGSELSEDNLARECLEGSVGERMECLDEKSFSYYYDGYCEKALKVYEDASVDGFDNYSLLHLYDEAHSLSLICSDESVQEYWANKYEEILVQTEVTD